MGTESQVVKSQFLFRLTNLPVVLSALDQATSAYAVVKSNNFLFDYTLSTVENSVMYASDKARPVVKRFESGIKSADGLACKGLNKLEQLVPIIKEPTEKILQDTKIIYANALQSGVDRYNDLRAYGDKIVNAVKKYSSDKANELRMSEYGKLAISTANGALFFAENYVNTYLPASEDDDSKIPSGPEQPTLERVSYLCSVVHRRTRKLAASKLQELKETSINIQLKERLDQLKMIPENIYTNAIWVWSDLNKTPEPVPESTRMTVNQQAWYLAQQTAQTTVAMYNTSVTFILSYHPVFQWLVATYKEATPEVPEAKEGDKNGTDV